MVVLVSLVLGLVVTFGINLTLVSIVYGVCCWAFGMDFSFPIDIALATILSLVFMIFRAASK